VGDSEPIIVCRCEDVTLDEVEEAIERGYRDLETLKRYLRIGMGACQGRTCIPMLLRILARKLGKSVEELLPPTSRPPLSPVNIGLIAGDEDDEG